jgi:hypothetical protein
MSEHRTTETLRGILFDALDKVLSGEMGSAEARSVSLMADKIIDTAELELQYAAMVSRLDKDEQGISPGPILLTSRVDDEGK